jgi:signal transduction histidine kinase
MIKAENPSVEERERYLQVIHKNTATLNKLVSDLFELSKLDAKQIEARIEPFSIAELAQDVVMKYKPSADRKHLSIRMQPEGTIPLVNGDIGLVERALTNLIDNSIRYTPENGEIIVRVRGTADGADVIVEDSGPGIAKDDIIHLFDRFYRVEKSRNRDDGGSGLGLAIAQKVLEIQDIPLSVESTVGIGTQFKMHLQKVG